MGCRTRDKLKIIGSYHCPKIYADVRRRCVPTFATQRTSTGPGKVIHRQVSVRGHVSGKKLPGVLGDGIEDRNVWVVTIVCQDGYRGEQNGRECERDERQDGNDGGNATDRA